MVIKFSKPDIKTKDQNLVKKILNSGWLTHGKYTKLFEKSFCDYTRAKYSVTVSSCTAGLHLICMSLGVKSGDEVIVPAMTHTATAHAVEYTGGKAVFADVDLVTGNLSLDNIKKKVNKKTKAVIIVHMSGYPCEVDKILSYCKSKKIKLIEDCAHSVGSYLNRRHLGNYGIAGSFSFYPTKQITTGEGGMVITNDLKIYKKIKKLKAFGIDKDINERKKQGVYDVMSLGFNYRMTDFQSALGLKQILRYRNNLLKRKNLAKYYIDNLKSNKKIRFTKFCKDSSYFIFQIFCKSEKMRNKLLEELKRRKIGVSIHYAKPVPDMKFYKKKYNLAKKNFPHAFEYGKTNISLPVYPDLKKKQVKKICDIINNFN